MILVTWVLGFLGFVLLATCRAIGSGRRHRGLPKVSSDTSPDPEARCFTRSEIWRKNPTCRGRSRPGFSCDGGFPLIPSFLTQPTRK